MRNRDEKLLAEAYLQLYKEQTPQPTAQPQTTQSQSPQSGNLGEKLKQALNQGPAQLRAFLNSQEGKTPQVTELLTKGAALDQAPDDDKVKISGPAPTTVAGKIPTQNFIDLMQSVAFPLGSYEKLKLMLTNKTAHGIIAIDGNYIIDGHHRWSAVVAFFPQTGQMNALNISWPGQNSFQKLAAAQAAITGYVRQNKPDADVPSAGGNPETDILGKQPEQISQMIMSNINKVSDKNPQAGPLLGDEMMQQIIGNKDGDAKIIYDWLGTADMPQKTAQESKKLHNDRLLLEKAYLKILTEQPTQQQPQQTQQPTDEITSLRQQIANKIGQNLATIKRDPNAPPREDMPQFDPKRGGPELVNKGGEYTDFTTKLQKGELNVANPLTPGSQNTPQAPVAQQQVRR